MGTTEATLWEEYHHILDQWLDADDDRLRVIARTTREYAEGED